MNSTCPGCGYNLPHHRIRCTQRNITPLQLRFELADGDDSCSEDTCDACGHRFGYSRVKIDGERLVHRDLDCTRPGTWA